MFCCFGDNREKEVIPQSPQTVFTNNTAATAAATATATNNNNNNNNNNVQKQSVPVANSQNKPASTKTKTNANEITNSKGATTATTTATAAAAANVNVNVNVNVNIPTTSTPFVLSRGKNVNTVTINNNNSSKQSPANATKMSLHKVIVCQPTTERGLPVHFGGDPDGTSFLYASGSSIVIRNIANPDIVELYDEHSSKTSAARYSPNRQFIASADVRGKVRIWNVSDRKLQNEFQVLGGKIFDMSWLPNNKGIAVCGEGMGRFSSVIKIDTGGSLGDIVGHTKAAMSIAVSGNGNRIVTGSLDMTSNRYIGVNSTGFKYESQRTDHKNIINCVRFSPSGTLYCTTSTDKTAIVYDTENGVVKMTLSGHTGGVYGCSWSGDGKQLVTASADKNVKIWDVETQKCLSTFNLGDSLEFQQLGCIWQGDTILSLSLNSDINYIDGRKKNGVTRIVKGFNKSITAMCYNSSNGTIFGGAYDGVLHGFTFSDNNDTGNFNSYSDSVFKSIPSSSNQPLTGTELICHTNEVKGIMPIQITNTNANANTNTNTKKDSQKQQPGVISIGMDDCIRCGSVLINDNSENGESPKLLDTFVDTSGGGGSSFAVIGTTKSLQIFREGKIVHTFPLNFVPTALKISPNGSFVIVADSSTPKTISLHTFNIIISEKGQPSLAFQAKVDTLHRGAISAIAISNDGRFLATADREKEIMIWNLVSVRSMTVVVSKRGFHNSSITTLCFSGDSQYLVSGSNDQDIIVWNVSSDATMKSNTNQVLTRACHKGGVTAISFLNERLFASAGVDGNIKIWQLS